ncbi:MAG: sigma-54-dependent Fis family transcriptional regulator [Candidatus Omnitrophica bacterium]|nr:sigma-54-dependent Fis family transcriptional regulator [Candidatus Omnitrophota bacterium]
MSRILVVDDERNVLTSFQKLLGKEGHEVVTARSGEQALSLLGAQVPDLILMDIRMAGLSGLETFQRAKAVAPKVPVIMMTAYGTTETAIEAMKLGAFEYTLKPFDIPTLKTLIEKALAMGQLMRTPVTYGAADTDTRAQRMIGKSPRMYEVYKLIGQVAPSNVTVLIRGESGTGKELVARAVYHHSQRAEQPFLAVNCAAIPETLLESELFGYEKGAFTGAIARKPGKFEQANGGTIFLDEIGDMSPSTQAKVLRVLQEGACERLGGQETIRVDVRLLAATNKNLDALIHDGRFREDLYYRLNVVSVTVPPLRERKEDIPLLAEYFLKRYTREFRKERTRLSPEALERLTAYAWPGNVRELENCIKQAVVLGKGEVLMPEHLRLGQNQTVPTRSAPESLAVLGELARQHLERAPGNAYQQLIEQVEAQLILEALKQTQGNLAQAAKLLGITRPTLREKVSKYRIQRNVQLNQQEG